MTVERDPSPTAANAPSPLAHHQSQLGWIPYLGLCAAGLTVALTWLGPSAADGLDSSRAFAFWALHVGPLIALLALVQLLLGKLPRIQALPGFAQILLTAVIASLLFAPLALVVDAMFQAEGSVDEDDEGILLGAISEITHFFVPVCLTWLLINAPSLRKLEGSTGLGQQQVTPVEAAKGEAAPNSEFWSRLPGRLGRDLVALSAELHYLRVYTTQGDTLILFPFGQAVGLLAQENGMQIHRSHWVSLAHVDEVITENGRMFCKMIGGLVLPVSRSYRAALREALRHRATG